MAFFIYNGIIMNDGHIEYMFISDDNNYDLLYFPLEYIDNFIDPEKIDEQPENIKELYFITLSESCANKANNLLDKIKIIDKKLKHVNIDGNILNYNDIFHNSFK